MDFIVPLLAAHVWPRSGQRANEVTVCGGMSMNNRIVECASRAGRDFSEFMKGEKNMVEALRFAEEFTEQLRIYG